MKPITLTRLTNQLERLECLNDQPEHRQPTRPTGEYLMRFYDGKRKLLSEHDISDCHFLARSHELYLLGTPLEYMIRLAHTAFYKRNEYDARHKNNGVISYVDILCARAFVCRHFYRGGQLSPLVSYESNVNHDAYARLRQITTMPTLNWSAFLNDAAWGRVSRNISQRELVNKYSLRSEIAPK